MLLPPWAQRAQRAVEFGGPTDVRGSTVRLRRIALPKCSAGRSGLLRFQEDEQIHPALDP